MRHIKRTFIIVLSILVSLGMNTVAFAETLDSAVQDTGTETSPASTYTVTFKVYNKVVQETIIQEDQLIKKPSDPKPKKKNEYFSCWIDQHGGQFDFDTKITENTTLTARFEFFSGPIPPQKRLVISFRSNGGTRVKDQHVASGDKIKKPKDPKRKGFQFIGWYLKEGRKWNFKNEPLQNLTLYAKWKKASGIKNGTTSNYWKGSSPATGDTSTPIAILFSLCSMTGILLVGLKIRKSKID